MSKTFEQSFFNGAEARKIYVSIKAAIVIPLLIAFIAGVWIGLFFAVLLWSVGFSWWYKGAAIMALLSGFITWTLMLVLWWNRRIKSIEDDAYTLAAGKLKSYQTTRVELPSATGSTLYLRDIDASDRQLEEIARRLAFQDASLSQGSLLDIFGGRRSAVQAFQGSLVTAQFAYWKNPEAHSAGMVLTQEGKDYFAQYITGSRKIIESHATTPPHR